MDYFKPAPRPSVSRAPNPAVKQPMQKRPVEDNSSIAVAIFSLPTIKFYDMVGVTFAWLKFPPITMRPPNKATPMR